MRAAAPVVMLVLLASSFAVVPAGATPTLAADAGDSQIGSPSALLSVQGAAIGGVAPYTYSWSLAGDGSRFADAHAAATTFDPSGLTGTIALTLQVEDANGAVASDSVNEFIKDPSGGSSVLLQRDGNAALGEPVGITGLNGPIGDQDFPFEVASGTSRLDATLDWDDNMGGVPTQGNDFDFELLDPSGNSATGSAGQTSNKPEHVTVDNPVAGTWTARVEPFLSTPDTFHVTVLGIGGGAGAVPSLPDAYLEAPYQFGTLDAQDIYGGYTVGPTDVATWDLDGDGVFEATGDTVTGHLAPGSYAAALRITNAEGLRNTTHFSITVRTDVDRVLRLGCGGDPARVHWAMEFTATQGTCWMHDGHHTYYLGDTYTLAGGNGFVFSVEHQLTLPAEHDANVSVALDASGPSVDPAVNVTDPIHVAVSLDGQAWHEVGAGHLRYVNDPFHPQPDQATGFDERQNVFIDDLQPSTEPFRFVRFSETLSAWGGLAGYMDASWADLAVRVAPAPVDPPLTATARDFSCADGSMMEDFFAAHPCTFGGTWRYDAPSFFETYYLGTVGSLDHVSGTFQVAPWRLDDWVQPGDYPLPGDAGGLVDQAVNTRVFVESSVDGVHWDVLGIAPAMYGVPGTFDFAGLGGHAARFVRVFPDYHPDYLNTGPTPSLHHPEAFFLGSSFHLEGALPSAGGS